MSGAELGPPPELAVVGMTKNFGALTALAEVSFRLAPGAFHVLLGENRAGKSTLVKCIIGYHKLDRGKIFLDGAERDIASPRQAHALGIGMVYQHFTLVPNMTVAKNLVLARPDLPNMIDWNVQTARLERFLARIPFRIDLRTLAASLSAGEKQKVEIVKQLFLGSRILILYEPTSVLTPDEADQLLGLLREMAAARQISVLMITHKLREVMAFAQEVTVLRHGRLVGGGRVGELTPADLTRMMVGADALAAPAARVGPQGGKRPPRTAWPLRRKREAAAGRVVTVVVGQRPRDPRGCRNFRERSARAGGGDRRPEGADVGNGAGAW